MLLDTSGLLSYFDGGDARHKNAVKFFEQAAFRLTHSYVLGEFIPLCQVRGLNRLAALSFVTDILGSPLVETVWIDEVLYRSALALLQNRLDKSYSLCDAMSC